MEPTIYSWNSLTAINDGSNYSAYIVPGQLANLSANPVSIPRAGLFPFFATTVLNSRVMVIQLVIKSGNNIATFRETLKGYFDVTDPVKHNLVIKDSNDSDKQWYVSGKVTQFVQESQQAKNSFFISIYLDEPVWKLVTAATNTWNITASAQTNAITNGGNLKVAPSFAITPTSARANGLQYRRWIPIYNVLDVPFEFCLDITAGGLDTATLTTAKMQADGDDFRVWLNGLEVDRWLSAMDTSATLCHVNISLQPRQEGATSVTIASSGAIMTITFATTKANKNFLQALNKVNNKVVLIDDEAFKFTGINTATYQLTGITRAMKNTSMAVHTAPKTARWIENDLWILYGDSTLTAPDTDDTHKPIFALTSINSSLTFTNYFDSTSNRPGAWQGELNTTKTNLSYTFTSTENNFVNPSTELGLAMRNSPDQTLASQEQAQLDWIFNHPAGITDVVFSGEKYFANISFPSIVGLQTLQESAIWITASNLSAPSAVYTWEAFGPTTVSLGATYNTIRFVMDGSLALTPADAAMVQFDTIVLTIDSTKLPVIGTAAEQAIAFFDFTLTDNTTGEYITCKTPCPLNDTLTIDCENKLITLSNGERANLGFSTERVTWLDLKVGSNTLQYDETGVAAVTIITSHRDRLM